MTIYYYLEENSCLNLMTIFIISSPSWVIRWPFIMISKKPHRMTISWRQVRRKNWWLAQAAFPPSRCRSYVWIVTDKTGKNDLIEISFVSTAWPWQSIHRIFARCAKESHLIAVQSKIYFSLVLSSYEGKVQGFYFLSQVTRTGEPDLKQVQGVTYLVQRSLSAHQLKILFHPLTPS